MYRYIQLFFLLTPGITLKPAFSSLGLPSKSLPDDLHSFGSQTGLKMAKLSCR